MKIVVFTLLIMCVGAHLGCSAAGPPYAYLMPGVTGLGTTGPVAVLSFLVSGEQNYHPRWLAEKEFDSLSMSEPAALRANRTMYSWLGSAFGLIELIPPRVCDSVLSREPAAMSLDSAIIKVARELHCPHVVVLRINDFRSYYSSVYHHGDVYMQDVTSGNASLQLYDDHARPVWVMRTASCMPTGNETVTSGLIHGDVESYINFLVSQPFLHNAMLMSKK